MHIRSIRTYSKIAFKNIDQLNVIQKFCKAWMIKLLTGQFVLYTFDLTLFYCDVIL